MKYSIKGQEFENSNLTDEQKRLFNMLRQQKMNDWVTLSRPDYANLWNSVIDKYPESAHFIYELIQNADDALADEVSIFLFHDKLVFKHNGKRQFTLTDCSEHGHVGDINSITSVAYSTKKDDEHVIGKFGVGFKSVFQYTDVPSIYDDTFWFRIDHYIIPTLLGADHELRHRGETLFDIPFKDSATAFGDILNRLKNLRMPALFLPHVKKVRWKVENEESMHEYTKDIVSSGEEDGIQYDYCCINESEEKCYAYLFHRNLSISGGKYDISVGYFLNTDGSLDVTCNRPLYCFFPTSETLGGCFVGHAPFLLTDNRDRIKPSEKVNKEFLRGIAELAADALLSLRDIGLRRESLRKSPKSSNFRLSKLLVTDNVYHILALIPQTEDEYERYDYLKQCYLEKLKNERLILNRSGAYVTTSEVRLATTELERLLSSCQVSQLLSWPKGVDFVYLRQYRGDFKSLQKELSVSDFDNKALALRLNGKFMSSQSVEWIDQLLSYIEEKAQPLWKTEKVHECNIRFYQDSWSELLFRFAPIALTKGGDWIAPFTYGKEHANVCLPYEGFKDVEIGTFGKVLDSDMYKKHKTFYNALNIKKPDYCDYIRNVILPHSGIKNDEDILLREFKIVYCYLNNHQSEELIGHLKRSWFLRTTDKKGKMQNVDQSYIPTDDFISYAKGSSAFDFVDINFYAKGIEVENQEIIDFLNLKLGVKDAPQVKRKDLCYVWEMPSPVEEFLGTQYLSKSKTPSFIDFNLEGYDCHASTKDWSHAFWRFIRKIGVENYAFGTLTYCLYREWYYNENSSFESSYLSSLKYDKWVCRQDGTFCAPTEITKQDFHDAGYEEDPRIERNIDFLDKILEKQRQEQYKEEHLKLNAVIEKHIAECKRLIGRLISKSEENEGRDSANVEIAECIESFAKIAESVGTENLPFLAEHIEEFMNVAIDSDGEHSMVRRIVNYIGRKIYEQYLINKGIKYEVLDNSPSKCDFVVNEDEKYVSVISTLKSIIDNRIPIGISPSQNVFLRNHPNIQMRIVRISLKDIFVLSQYERIVGVYGKLDEPEFNERLRKACDELAINYWRGASIEEFSMVSPEYSIKIERYL